MNSSENDCGELEQSFPCIESIAVGAGSSPIECPEWAAWSSCDGVHKTRKRESSPEPKVNTSHTVGGSNLVPLCKVVETEECQICVLGPWIVDEVVCLLLLILIGLLLLCCCCCLIWILLGLLRGCKRKEKEDRGEDVGGVELTDNPMLGSGNSPWERRKAMERVGGKAEEAIQRKKKVWSLRRLFQKHDSVELGSDDEDDDEEWDTAYDDDGNEYFYNAKTGRSTWTVPSLKRKMMKKFSKKRNLERVDCTAKISESDADGNERARKGSSDTAGSWQSNVDADGNTYYYDENGRSTWTDPQRKASNRKMWGQRSIENEFEKESDRARSDTAGSWQSNVDADGNTYYYDENGRPTWTDPQRKASNRKMWGQRSIENEDGDWR